MNNKVEEIVDIVNEHFDRTMTSMAVFDIEKYGLDLNSINILFTELRHLGYIVAIRGNSLSVMLSETTEDDSDHRIIPGFVELHTISVKRNGVIEPHPIQNHILINISSINIIKPFEDSMGNKTLIEVNDVDYYSVVETVSEIKGLLLNNFGEG